MPNKAVFKTSRGKTMPPADTANEAGGMAYKLGSEAALATMAATCSFGDAYYLNAEQQLEQILQLARVNSPEFVAKTAVFARERGFMKDAPALLCAHLGTCDKGLFRKVFNKIIRNGRMLRTFVQMVRSGVTGRKSLGTVIKREVVDLLARVSGDTLFRWSVGNDPSLVDIIKMTHPKPNSPEKEALYGYLLKKAVITEKLPPLAQHYEAFVEYKKWLKTKGTNPFAQMENREPVSVPPVPFQMIDNLDLTAQEWAELFKSGGWHFCRMNLNTAERHGVLKDPAMVELIAKRLANRDEILRSKVFPYQLLMAYKHAADKMPRPIVNALHAAMDISVENIPELNGSVAVAVDTSGSMGSPVTGARGSATSAALCVDVAALFAAAIARRNMGDTKIIPFDTRVHRVSIDPNDSILTNAKKLARNGGGTNCACALASLNEAKHRGDLVIYVSDNEAWVESPYELLGYRQSTGMAKEWATYKSRNPNARLVNINIQMYTTSQMPDQKSRDVYQVAGFSDQIFTLISDWMSGRGPGYWVETIKAISLDDAVEAAE